MRLTPEMVKMINDIEAACIERDRNVETARWYMGRVAENNQQLARLKRIYDKLENEDTQPKNGLW